MDIDAILENLNKAYDIDVESILNGLNAGLDDDQHIGPAFFASIMCGECTTSVSSSVNKSALSPVAVTEVQKYSTVINTIVRMKTPMKKILGAMQTKTNPI